MKKAIYALVLLALALWAAQALAIPLQQAYSEATPGAGYDKLVFLNPDEVYTGGLHLLGETVCIISCGAEVDLQGSRIMVEPSALLDICGVVLTNSDSAALKYSGAGVGWIDHCTFWGNYDCVYFWDGADMTLTSNVFSFSSHYGVYCHEDAQRWMAFNDAWENAAGHYKEYCPG